MISTLTPKAVVVWALVAGFLSFSPLRAADSNKDSSFIREVNHAPSQPRPGEAVVITVKLPTTTPPKSVVLRYQLVDPGKYIALQDPGFKSHWISIPMNHDGKHGEAVAGRQNIFGDAPGGDASSSTARPVSNRHRGRRRS